MFFAFYGHVSIRGPNGPNLYLGHDGECLTIFIKATTFESVLNQLQVKNKPSKLYMFIGSCGSGGLLEDFGFNNQLTNHNNVNPPIARYPSVIAFMSSIRGMKSKSSFNYRWKCPSSNFLYVVIQAIETYNNVTNLELAQCIDLVLEEVESVLVVNCVTRHNFLMEHNLNLMDIYNMLLYHAPMLKAEHNFYLIRCLFEFYFLLLWFLTNLVYLWILFHIVVWLCLVVFKV
jgi:hypothetical protein